MKRIIINLLWFILTPFLFAQNENDSRINGLDTLITRIIEEWNVPGCAVTIVKKNEIIYKKGVGYIDLKTKMKVDENTIFPIASCTKSFTAALIGILADEGKIDINKPANHYLPILRFSDPFLTMTVTPCDMMTHVTGIPRHDISWLGFENAPRDSLVQLIEFFQKSAGLREKFIYNNYMYTALGAMAEHIENGKTWEDQIKERFFIPLGMNSSSTSFEELQKANNKAYPHDVTFQMEPIEIPFKNEDNMGPCGSINSNANDIANWLITILNGGEYRNKVIIPTEFYKQSTTPQWRSTNIPSGKINYLGYGFGWNIAIYQGHYSVYHGGSVDGFGSLVLFLPNDNLGMAIFINSRGSSVPMIIANYITDKLLDLPYTDWSKNQLSDFINQQKQYEIEFNSKCSSEFPPTHNLEDYCGEYLNPGYGKINIFQEGDSLVGKYGSLNVWLKHHNYDGFKAILYSSRHTLGKIDVWNRPAVFIQNNNGEISKLTILLERQVDPIIFEKTNE
jgi:CubicO group peptidase (beta-lactamase class C family)